MKRLSDLKEGDFCCFRRNSHIYFKVVYPYDGCICKLRNMLTDSIVYLYCDVEVFFVQLNLFN